MYYLYRLFILTAFCYLSIGKMQAQCTAYAGTDYSQGLVFVMEHDQIVWTHPAPESNDLWVLPGGNLLFTTGKGVLEMTRQNDTLFCYTSESAIFACQRLKNGNTFIGECNTGRLLEVNPSGRIEHSVCILPEGVTDGGFAFMRNARRLDNGNYLVAHYGNEEVKEYNAKGKVVWSVKVPGGPHSVIRLPDGHTLVSVADKTQNPRIVELDKKGAVVWELSNADMPGAPLKFLGGMHYFPDGRLLFANWVGHVNPDQRSHLFLVNKAKEIRCVLNNREGIQTLSSVFCMDAKSTEDISYH